MSQSRWDWECRKCGISRMGELKRLNLDPMRLPIDFGAHAMPTACKLCGGTCLRLVDDNKPTTFEERKARYGTYYTY